MTGSVNEDRYTAHAPQRVRCTFCPDLVDDDRVAKARHLALSCKGAPDDVRAAALAEADLPGQEEEAPALPPEEIRQIVTALAALRRELGWSLDRMARRLGCLGPSWLARIEKGERKTTAAVVHRMREVLDSLAQVRPMPRRRTRAVQPRSDLAPLGADAPLGDRLRHWRLTHGWSQARVAKETGVAQCRISEVERGKYLGQAGAALEKLIGGGR